MVEYRGSRLEEIDLDAVLRRRPEVALIDELAHTNVPGSGPHEKRWQDVLDILGAGINVITTVNIQHLESIADDVEQMTRAKVRERVPDRVVRQADQIELADSSAEQLRRRMLHGNIYPKEKVPQALSHFFRTDNLIALVPRFLPPVRLTGAFVLTGACAACCPASRLRPLMSSGPASNPITCQQVSPDSSGAWHPPSDLRHKLLRSLVVR